MAKFQLDHHICELFFLRFDFSNFLRICIYETVMAILGDFESDFHEHAL